MASYKKSTALAALILAAGLGLTGCGDGDKAAEGTSSNTDKGSNSAEAQPQKASSELSAEDFADRLNQAQLEAGSAHMSMSMTQEGMTVDMDGDILMSEDVNDISMQMTMAMGELGDMELIMASPTEVYMSMGEMTQGKFVKMPESALGDMNLEQIQEQSNPAAQAEVWKKTMKDFAVEDGEKIDGVDTKKYVVTMDTKKALEEAGTLKDVPADALDQLEDEMVVEMYIGSDDLPRRFVMESMGIPITIDFSNWGEKVDIQAPAADQILDEATAKSLGLA